MGRRQYESHVRRGGANTSRRQGTSEVVERQIGGQNEAEDRQVERRHCRKQEREPANQQPRERNVSRDTW